MSEYESKNEASIGGLEEVDLSDDDSDDNFNLLFGVLVADMTRYGLWEGPFNRFAILIAWQVCPEANSLLRSKMSEYESKNEASIGGLEEVDLSDDDSDDNFNLLFGVLVADMTRYGLWEGPFNRFVILIAWQVCREVFYSLLRSKMSEYESKNEASIGGLEEVDLSDDDSDTTTTTTR
ncbi:Hypothetical predicted protein [Paramuricea clavata]|uniref:Uncharacterized protein n=1 Tax=Paramuricea clavata TaxID=317549 RepID=A0A6S7H1W5_PARCT|nr:Hypothetical predicted protein [Paramuricea clavata]